MIFKRKIYDEVLKRKKNNSSKYALFIRGARRVGKTTLAEEVCKNEFKSYIKIDFREVPNEIKNLFNPLADLELFFSTIQSYYNVRLFEKESAIIFDEIQLFPKVRESITKLVKDGRYSYIETGSLASIIKKSFEIVIPSEEYPLDLYPLDFEEFLWALNDCNSFEFVKNSYKNLLPLGNATHKRVMNLFRNYLLVGGMPQAINEFIETNNFEQVDFVKQGILNLYKNDVASQREVNVDYIQNIIDVIPSELSKHDKKFVISHSDVNARLDRYKNAFNWLNEAYIVNYAFNTNDPSVAFSLTSNDTSFKCYFMDTGLLISLCYSGKKYIDNKLYNAILFDSLHINEGMIIENVVAQSFKANNRKLFFYSRNNEKTYKNEIEVDFLIEKDNKVSPIEVKSGSYSSITSLKKYKERFTNKVGKQYVLYDKDLKVEGEVIYLPYYMSILL